MNIHDPADKVFIILGMHKSGTSILSKALKDQGVKMTDTEDTSFFRHYEDINFLELNKEMLKKAGGNWRNIPLKYRIVGSGLGEKVKNLIARYKTKMWGWKDPRTALTVENYLPYLKDDDVYLVAIFRKPEKVKAALQRDKGDGDWDNIINTYNRNIIEAIKNFVGL